MKSNDTDSSDEEVVKPPTKQAHSAPKKEQPLLEATDQVEEGMDDDIEENETSKLGKKAAKREKQQQKKEADRLAAEKLREERRTRDAQKADSVNAQSGSTAGPENPRTRSLNDFHYH